MSWSKLTVKTIFAVAYGSSFGSVGELHYKIGLS